MIKNTKIMLSLMRPIVIFFFFFGCMGKAYNYPHSKKPINDDEYRKQKITSLVKNRPLTDLIINKEKKNNRAAKKTSVPIELRSELSDSKPISEELLRLKEHKISIDARNTPLRDVLYTIVKSTGLNIVLEKGVNPELPVTTSLDNVSAEDALTVILSSMDYFFSIGKNILLVKAVDTQIFEFGIPSITQDYAVDVGGDMLGDSSSASTAIKGSVVQRASADKESYNFWDSFEKSIASLLGDVTGGHLQSGKREMPEQGFTINRMAGVIVVTATHNKLKKIEQYITNIKNILKKQIIVEARIVEVQLQEGMKHGIDWSFIDGASDTVELGASNFASVVGSFSNFSVNLARSNFSALLQALEQRGEIHVLSNPRIKIMNGQTSLLSVGRKVNFISQVEQTITAASSDTTPTITFSVKTDSVLSGIIFGLAPYVGSKKGDKITMNITPIISELVSLEDKTIGNIDDTAITISLPTMDLRELSTTVRVTDGNIVIIGGLIQSKEKIRDNKIPFLGDIPFLGNLFTSHNKTNEKTELVILLKAEVAKE